MINIYNLTRKKLEEKLLSMNEKAFRSTQIYEWIYRKNVKSFEMMTNIKKDLIEYTKQQCELNNITLITSKLERV